MRLNRTIAAILLFALPATLMGLTHTVRKGENLTSIAQAYSVSVAAIKKANNIKDADVIRIGQFQILG